MMLWKSPVHACLCVRKKWTGSALLFRGRCKHYLGLCGNILEFFSRLVRNNNFLVIQLNGCQLIRKGIENNFTLVQYF